MTTNEHPTADMVYMHVKKDFPNISLGTVYRNLNLLTDIGEAVKIATPDGGDRFDGRVEPHNHFLCTMCGRLLDLELDMNSIEEVNRLAAENFDGIIRSSSTLFYGECSDCIKKS
jgi:Fur family peroxide stress response transcriptional regulator